MKLNKLNLIRFGPYTDFPIDLESGDKKFHLFYGPNEAGKSTALRAISSLLYGIDETTTDGHIHGKADLRIGAIISADGDQLEIIRRKGRKNTLLDKDEKPLDESLLTSKYLSGVSKELFTSMFGLGHDELVEGGRKLLAGEGEIGESLFGASSGIRNIHALRQTLRSDAESIFTPAARTKPLNVEIRKFKEADKKSRQFLLRPKNYLDLQRQYEDAKAKDAELEEQIKEFTVELTKKERLQRTLPLIAKRINLLEKKDGLGSIKSVLESFTSERISAQSALEKAEVQIRRLLKEKQNNQNELDSLHIPTELLERQNQIKEFKDRVAVSRKALTDMPALEAEIKLNLHEAKQILRNLGRPASIDNIEDLRIDLATQETIHSLSREYVRHETNLQSEEKNFSDAKQALEELQEDGTPFPLRLIPDELDKIVSKIRKKGDLDAHLKELLAEHYEVKEEAIKRCLALRTEIENFEEITKLPMPLKETVEEYEEHLQTAIKKRETLENQAAECRKGINRLAIDLAELQQKEAVLSEASLIEVRARREELWQKLKGAWQDDQDMAAGHLQAIVDDYEDSVTRADETSDILRKNADLVARYATLSLEKKRTEDELDEIQASLETVKREEDLLSSRWREIIKPLHIEEYSPREFSGWLNLFEKFSDTFVALQRKERELANLRSEIEGCSAHVSEELVALEEKGAGNNESLSDLLERAEGVVAGLKEKRSLWEQKKRDIVKAEKMLAAKKTILEKHTKKLDEWRIKWAKAIQQLGYDANTDVEVVSKTLEFIQRLFSKTEDAAKLQMRASQINQDADRLKDDVLKFSNKYFPKSIRPDFTEIVSELLLQVTAGNEAVNRQKKINTALEQIQEEIITLEREKQDALNTINRLLKSAGCQTAEELEIIEEKSSELRDILTKLEDVDEQLLNEGISIDDLLEQAKEIDRDSLPAEIQELKEKREQLNNSRRSTLKESVSLEDKLEKMDGSQSSADAADEAQEAMAAIRQHVEIYARLKLSAAILEREIEDYRQKNQGPIMKRTAVVFRRITLGSFQDLTTGFDAKDRLIFLCVGEDGRKVTVDGLSDGTRDQLYLALRIAGIERHIEHNVPLPVVVDDLLIKADDFRSKAILEILGELSQKTQVIFFTHHSKLVELAREVIPENLLKEHFLNASA